MAEHKYHQKIQPKYVDLDTEIRYVKSDTGAVRYLSNLRIGKRQDQTKGACINIRGTLLVPNNYLPVGDNINLGCVTNKSRTFLLFLNWNSNNKSGIYMYNPSLDEPIQLLFQDSPTNIILGFHKYFNIKGTKAKIIQDEHFFWTDMYNSPRYHNIKFGLNYKKKKVYEIQQIDTDIVDYDIIDFKYNGIAIDVFIGNLVGGIIPSNGKLADYFDIEDCTCSVELTEKVPNSTQLISSSDKIRIVPKNFYTDVHHERQIDLVCYPPNTAPQVVLKKNLKQQRNFLSGNTWQFRTKNIYFDDNESAWSPWSKLINTSGNCEEEYNYIQIDYTDPIFDCYNDIPQLNVIKAVVIGYRNTNQGNLHSFVTIKQCDIPKVKQVYDFYNDISASIVNEYDDKVKQYDLVPLQCGALNAADNRLLVGDVTENYEEKCFDFDVEVEYHPKDETQQYDGKASCWIDIKNFSVKSINGFPNFPIRQTSENAETYVYGAFEDAEYFDQKTGTKGLVVYLAGTDNVVITKQIIADGIDVNISDDDFGIVRAVTADDKTKISEALRNNNLAFRQQASIEGLKDGVYIMRIASHWCSYGNKLGKGDAYDLDNGLVWQKTSTNIKSVNGVQGIFEAVIHIVNGVMIEPPPIFVLEDVSGAEKGMTGDNIFVALFGSIGLFGLFLEIGKTHCLVQGYVVDSESVSQKDVYEGLRIERTAIKMIRTGEIIGNEKGSPVYAITDYNGYFYGRPEVNINDIGGNNKILASKGKGMYWGDLIGNDGDMAILWNGDDPFRGNLTELKNETCDTFDNSGTGDNFNQKVVNNFILPYLVGGHNVTKNFRTLIKGRVVNSQGYQIPGIQVVATNTDRFDTTDINGNFGIILYAYAPIRSDRRIVTLLFSGDECNNVNFTMSYTIDLGVLAPPKYNDSHPYDVGDIVVDIEYRDLIPFYYLKNGDTYDIAATIQDRANRKTTVLHNDKKHRIRLPFTTERIQDYFPTITQDTRGNAITATTKAEGFFTLKIKNIEKPPIWSTHLYFLRTEGQVYSNYVQIVVSDVKYIINYRETLNTGTGVMEPDPVTTTFDNHDANEIYLDIVSSFIEYKDRNSNSEKGWVFEKGDRLRFVYKTDGTLYDFVEVEIKEQRGNYFVIDNIDALDELKLGFVVELFRLKTKVEDKKYFEIGEFIKVNDRYLPTRSWQNSEIILNTGDAYRRVRKMIAKHEDDRIVANRLIEDPTPDDTYSIKDNDIGRSDFINSQYRQVRRLATIRYGDTILTDSSINNIRRFDAEQQVTSNNNDGAITIIDKFKNIIFVAQENKCHTRYVGRSTLNIGGGDVALSDPNTILSIPDYLVDEYGCKSADSYQRYSHFGTFFDTSNGIMAAYFPQNGLNNISGFDDRYESSKLVDSFFNELGTKLSDIPKEMYHFIVQMNSVYKKDEAEVNISMRDVILQKGQDISDFSGTGLNSNIGTNDVKFKKYDKSEIDINIPGFTMVYDTEEKMWLMLRSYNPTSYGMLNNKYVGFVGGDMHLMEGGDDNSFNNFFGTKYKSAVHVIMNTKPSDTKFFTNWSVESNLKWNNPYVKVYNHRAFREIISRTPDGKIVKQLGVYVAPFMFDVNTPNVANPLISGNKLIGETLIMHLENDDETEVVLYAVNVYAGYIFRSNF